MAYFLDTPLLRKMSFTMILTQNQDSNTVIYDEANIMVPEPGRSPASRCLIELGYANKDTPSINDTTQPPSSDKLKP
jgi:hypothetical protein